MQAMGSNEVMRPIRGQENKKNHSLANYGFNGYNLSPLRPKNKKSIGLRELWIHVSL